CLRGIDADAPVHRADRRALGRRIGAHGRLGGGQRRVQLRIAFGVDGLVDHQHAQADDRLETGCDADRDQERASPFFGMSMRPLNVEPSAIATRGAVSVPSTEPPALSSNFSPAWMFPLTVPSTTTTLACTSAS